MKNYTDVRTPADPEDYETTQSRSALPPAEFSVSTGADSYTFTIKDRQSPAQRAQTVAYRIYFLPAAFASGDTLSSVQRVAGQRVSSLVAEVQAPGRGTDLTVTDAQFFGQEGYYFCVGVNRREIEAPPEHVLYVPAGSGVSPVPLATDLTMPTEFSVAGNPIGSVATLAVTKATQSANRVYAGPTTGAAAAPTFRALVAADLPSLGLVTRAWIMADPNFSTGTSFERPNYREAGGYGLLQLAPQRTWTETIADAKTNVPAGWTLGNSTKLSSADANTTSSGGLYMDGVTTSTYTWAAGDAPYYYRVYNDSFHFHRSWIARLQVPSSGTSTGAGIGMVAASEDTLANNARIYITGGSGAGGCLIGYGVRTTTGSIAANQTDVNNGIWVMIESYADYATVFYQLANQATPPTQDWNPMVTLTQAYTNAGQNTRLGFYIFRSSAVSPVRGSVLHFNDQRFHHSEPQHTTRLPQPFATGFDSSSPTVTLVSGFDLGRSAATVADADVQAALTEIVNPRMTDTATWTFSVQRGSSAPVSPSTYAAAGSVTVGGSGRYISVTAKCLSTGRIQAGSLDMSRFRIPYTP